MHAHTCTSIAHFVSEVSQCPPSSHTYACNLKCTYILRYGNHLHLNTRTPTHTHSKLSSVLLVCSAQYIQVHRRGLGQIEEQTVDFLYVESHVRLSLPASQHQVVNFFRTGPRALQDPALGYTLYHLQTQEQTQTSSFISSGVRTDKKNNNGDRPIRSS